MKEVLQKMTEGAALTRDEACSLLVGITEEQYNEHQIAALLM